MFHSVGDTVQIDTLDMSALGNENKNFSNILIAVASTSLCAWAAPCRSRSGRHVARAMDIILSAGYIPHNIESQLYREFDNEYFFDLMQRYKITHCRPTFSGGSIMIERLVELLESRILQQLYNDGTCNWIDVLDDIIEKYNSTRNDCLHQIL